VLKQPANTVNFGWCMYRCMCNVFTCQVGGELESDFCSQYELCLLSLADFISYGDSVSSFA